MLKKLVLFFVAITLVCIALVQPVMAAPTKGQLNIEWLKLDGDEEAYIRDMITEGELEERILSEATSVSKGVLKSVGEKDGSDGLGLLYLEEAKFGELAMAGVEIDKPDYFGAKISGYITPKESGKYKFRLFSDDHCRLKLGDDWIVGVWGDDMDPELEDNEGYLADGTYKTWNIEAFSKEIDLEAGKSYPIYAEYWDGWGGHFINITWSLNGGDQKLIDAEYLSSEAVSSETPDDKEKPDDKGKDQPKTADASMLINLLAAGVAGVGGLGLYKSKKK